MIRSLIFTTTFSLFILSSTNVFGQRKFKDSYRNIWIKSLGISEEQKASLNFYIPVRFRGDFPVLNKKYKSSKFTYVYYVLKTQTPSQKVFSLYNSGYLHSFYTDSIKSIVSQSVDVGLLSSGAMVNFNFYNKDYNKEQTGILYLDNPAVSEVELYEVLVCSTCDDRKIRNKIQTYLAVKYGITLAQKENYVASDERKVWDEELDSKYNHRIIGIARDDFFSLEQTASFSHIDTSFIVAKSKSQVADPMPNLAYVMVGDNDGEKKFDAQTGLYKRRWLVQNKGDSDVYLDLHWSIKPEREVEYYLHSRSDVVFRNEQQDSLRLSFKDILIKRGQNYYFTIEQKKPFEFKIFEDDKSLNKKYYLGVNDVGKAPFYITATDSDTQQEYYFVSQESTYPLEQLPPATYHFTVVDAGNHQAKLQHISLNAPDSSLVTLANHWLLENNKPLEITPNATTPNLKNDLTFEWYYQDKLISNSAKLTLNYPGSFTLQVSDKYGKKEHFGFTVSDKPKQDKRIESQWVVSPNPVERGEEFTVTYDFDSPKKVDFYIYTLDGKFILRKELGVVEKASFVYTLQGATTYLIIPIINSKASIQKLIVK